MNKNFALLDKNNVVIGTISLPNYLDFDKPHHVPHIEINEGDKVRIGAVFHHNKFSTSEDSQRMEQDPPLAEGKRGLFNFLWRNK